MTSPEKNKPGARANEQTGPDTTEQSDPNYTRSRTLKQRAKTFIVNLTFWGVLLIQAADWLVSGAVRTEAPKSYGGNTGGCR